MAIDLNDYLKVSVSGIDGHGSVYAYLDKENFYLDNITVFDKGIIINHNKNRANLH